MQNCYREVVKFFKDHDFKYKIKGDFLDDVVNDDTDDNLDS